MQFPHPPQRWTINFGLIGVFLLAVWSLPVGAQPIVRSASLGWVPTNGEAATLVLGQPNFTSKTAATSQVGMRNSNAVAVDPTSGKIFVADNGNNRVLRFASLLALQNGAAAEGVLGQPDFTSSTPATSQAGMWAPAGVAVDTTGTLWVSNFWSSRVLRFDHAASKSNGAPADGVLGQPNFTDSNGVTSHTGMQLPVGVSVDGMGTVWVADDGNHRVLRFDHAATKANGAPADGVLGQPDFISGLPNGGPAGMYYPNAVAADGSNALWVADTYHNRVLRFDHAATKANGAPADGVLGQPNFTSYTGATSQTGMALPSGLTVDGSGTLWVGDSGNNRVLRFAAAATKANGAPADEVLGQPNFTSNAPATSQIGMNGPHDLAVDAAGSLWVADSNNNRVLHFGAGTATNFVYIPVILH